jgi:hypothetical protein
MNTGEGIISKIFSWVAYPGNGPEELTDWFAFFALALIASYLWSTVIKVID